MYRLAHLSDPHVPPETAPRRRELASKRMLGWINWQSSRRLVHKRAVLDALTGDMLAGDPDHIAVTGDLAIVSTPAEWQACRVWLQDLGSPHDVSLVPGNHDAYTRRAIPGSALAWREYMAGDPHTDAHGGFPYLRRRGPLAIVGCSSAIATAPFMATGRIGTAQLERLRALLADLAAGDLFRVVLLHHPPLRVSGDRMRRLVDASAFVRLIAEFGCELVLHGHEHDTLLRWTTGPDHAVPVVGVPSASALAHGRHDAARYNVYEITGRPGAWNCRMRGRSFDGVVFADVEDRALLQDGRAVPDKDG